MRLIPEIRRAWRMFSMQAGGLIVAWSALPAVQQQAVMEFLRLTPNQITAAMGLLVIVGRLVDQPRVRR
jgi:hypothetical protein